jgi:hypothetical protein
MHTNRTCSLEMKSIGSPDGFMKPLRERTRCVVRLAEDPVPPNSLITEVIYQGVKVGDDVPVLTRHE